jgi:hypothetical protein
VPALLIGVPALLIGVPAFFKEAQLLLAGNCFFFRKNEKK